MKYCSNCGTANEEKSYFCWNCGSSLKERQEEINEKDYHAEINEDSYPCTQNSQPISFGIKVLLYISTLFISLIGIIVGIIYMNDPLQEKRTFGKGLLIFAIIWTIIVFILPIIGIFLFFLPSFGIHPMYF